MDHTTEHRYPKASTNQIKKSVLIVGTGYIGSHIAKVLKTNGYTPVLIDKKPFNFEMFEDFYQMDLPKDIHLLDDIIKRYNIDSCICTAGYTSVGESVKNPQKYYKNNVAMTLQLINKLNNLNVKKFIFSSSAAAYGLPLTGVCKDDEVNLHPINPYGRTKLMVEQLLHDYNVAENFRSISLRFFNVAGADPDCELGEDYTEQTHIIPLAIQAGFTAKQFKLFGNDYNTPDGTCIRDYIHVMDVANAHLHALQKIQNEIEYDCFNIASGNGLSNNQILKEVQKHTGAMDIVSSPKRAGDPDTLVADISRSQSILGWKPTQSGIDNIVRTAVQWYKHLHKKEIN